MIALWRRLRDRAASDNGFTMIDIVVTMTVMSIVMVLFSAAVQQIYNAEERTEATSTSQSQSVTAFQRLDKQIRYASGISTQGLVGADQYVEFQTTNSGAAICTELRVHVANGQLQERTWTSGMTPLVPTAWKPLASGVSSSTPFTFYAADATYNFQRLEVNLAVKTGSNSNATIRQSDIIFTALNAPLSTTSTSSQTTSTATLCTEGRVVP